MLRFTIIVLLTSFCLLACHKEQPREKTVSFNGVSTKLSNYSHDFDIDKIYYSPEGTRVACVIKNGGKEAMRVNNNLDSYYDSVRNIVFSSGSQATAYIASNSSNEFVVYNGKISDSFESISELSLTNHGRPVYSAKKNNGWQIISGKQVSNSYAEVSRLFVSSDSTLLGYVATDIGSRKQSLYFCDLDIKKCQNIKYDSISAISYDSKLKKIIFAGEKDRKKTVIVASHEKLGAFVPYSYWYDDITLTSVSSNGEHFSFLATRNDKMYLVKDGVEEETEFLSTCFYLLTSDSGKTFHTGIFHNKVLAFIDGKRTGNAYESIHEPSVSQDGMNFVYEATLNATSKLVVNGREISHYDKIVTPQFTPDGKQIVFRARKNGARFVVVTTLDGNLLKEFSHYDAVWEISFSPDAKSFGYGVKAGNDLLWKVESL